MVTAKKPITAFQATALDEIPVIWRNARQTFDSQKTKNVEWRLVQLRKLYWALHDFQPKLLDALRRDLGKVEHEAMLSEIEWMRNDCMYLIGQLQKWTKDQKLCSPEVPLTFSMMKLRIRKEPLGSVLIIGPYNFPVQLLLSPLAGAIAAGCTAVVKPSELVPASAMVIRDLIEATLDRDAFQVVNGGVAETEALMDHKWDKIFFTGSPTVGIVIAKKAAESLTPVCLELGGKNPAFVTKKANLALAAKRLLWGKCMNAGQVCISHNYVLVEKEVVQTFITFLNKAYEEAFPNGAKASPDLARIVNDRHFARLKKMLDSTKGRIVMGGQMDEADRFMEPTAVLVDSVEDAMMSQESFGPIFSIYAVDSLDEGLEIARSVHRTPLALFSFGSQVENMKVLDEMTSGGATLNDSFLHASITTVPFGGVGDSGWGSYRGKASFDCFTHERVVADTPAWVDRFLRVRYMPYEWKELRRFRRLGGGRKPNFDRSGAVVRGPVYWLGLVLGLGGKGVGRASRRWCLVLASYYLLLRLLAVGGA